MKDIRILIVEDSPIVADVLGHMLGSAEGLEVVGIAPDGRVAVTMAQQLLPDVITMDLKLPEISGAAAVAEIMASAPTQILVLTGDPSGIGGDLALEALRHGAVDAMAKPAGWPPDDLTQQQLVDHVRFLAKLPRPRKRRVRRPRTPISVSRRPAPLPRPVIGIVASTGGPATLARALASIDDDLPSCLLIVQHLSAGFGPRMVRWLDSISPLAVGNAEEGAPIEPGRVWVAAGDLHMVVRNDRTIGLESGEPVSGYRPSGTVLLRSIAKVYRDRGAGMVLTGMGRDGADGLLELREAGGLTLAQDEHTSVVYGMPRVALEIGAASETVMLEDIAPRIVRIAAGHR